MGAKVAVEVSGRHYLERAGVKLLSDIDGSSHTILEARLKGYWEPNECRDKHERRHNRVILDVLHQMRRDNLEASPGWRFIDHLPGNQQIRPDRVTKLEIPDLTGGRPDKWAYEVELTAKNEGQVRERLRRRIEILGSVGPDRGSPGQGYQIPTAWILATRGAEAHFREIGRQAGLTMMITTTVEEAIRGPVAGRASVWRFDGDPVALVNRVPLVL